MKRHYYPTMQGSRSGLTFFEMIMVIGLFSGIMLLVLLFSRDIADFAVYFKQDLFAKQEMQLTLNTMLTEMRSATVAANGAYLIEAASSTAFVFFADTNADAIPERVRYFFGTSTVNKGVVRATGTPIGYPLGTEVVNPVITSVTTGTFRYYNSLYTGSEPAMTSTADVSLIRVAQFQVTVDQATSTRPGPVTSTITATLRNIGD